MAETVDYSLDVAKYADSPNAAAIDGIVRHCGIALRSQDSSLVAGADPKEVATVRESFLKRKLQLTQPDEELDSAIMAVLTKMKADRTKSRVTVYYLLAEHFSKLDQFI